MPAHAIRLSIVLAIALIGLVTLPSLSSAAVEKTRLTKERVAYLLHETSRSSVVVNNPGGGSAAIRTQALVTLAMFESVNSIERKYEPYLVEFSDIPSSIDAAKAHKLAAAATSVRHVLDWLYPGAPNQGLRFFHRELQNAMVNSIEGASSASIADGIALGKYIAQRLIENRTDDGWVHPPARIAVENGTGDCVYTYGQHYFPGLPIFSAYGFQVKAFGSSDPLYYQNDALYYLPPPPAPDSAENVADLAEVFGYGASNPANQTWTAWTNETGHFHAGYYGSYNDWSYDVLTTANITLEGSDLLRVLAIGAMASNDAHSAHWVWKYTYLRARPITAFRMMDTNRTGSPIAKFRDDNWLPTTVTAQTPEYPSGHASRTSGFVATFRLAFGDSLTYATQSFTLAPRENAETVAMRTYNSFSAMIDEVNDARIYGGVHYRTSVDAGTALGTRVAADYFSRLMRPLSA